MGIDPTEKVIEMAEKHRDLFPELIENLEYSNTTIEDFIEKRDLQDNTNLFDLVCCSEVVEHVNNQADFLKDCAKLVKPNGYMYVSTMAKTP